MAARTSFRQRVEEELQTLFVCPDALHQQQQQCLTGQGEQLLSKLSGTECNKSKAEQHFERCLQQQEPGAFGPDAPANTQKATLKSLLHALAFSNSNRNPGFAGMQALLQQLEPQQQGNKQPAFDSLLLRLLRRVSLWWYYRVMFDPLEQLVQLSSSYELLFQLMTPHQQLSCMGDILLVLACPALQDQSGQLDTPLHTATLLSMLKMAQQLASAEAELQEQQQQLASTMEQLHDKQEQPQPRPQPQPQLEQQCKLHLQAACQAAAVLTSPASTLLQLARQHGKFPCSSQQHLVQLQQEIQHAGVLPARALPCLLFAQHLPCLFAADGQQHGSMEVIGTKQAEVSLQQSNAARAVGTLLAQVSQLTPIHRHLWWHAYEAAEQADSLGEAILHLLRKCCSAVRGSELPQLAEDEDPVGYVLSWVLKAVGCVGAGQSQHASAAAAGAPQGEAQHQQQDFERQQGVGATAGQQQEGQQEGQQQQKQQQDGQQQEGRQQQQQEGGQQDRSGIGSQRDQQHVQEGPHPAEALRQLLDVLLCAFQGRFAEWMQEWKVGPCQEGRTQLLASLHCHCMQLLAQARDQLPAEICLLGQPADSPGCSAVHSPDCTSLSTGNATQQQQEREQQQQQQQQQREAWQLCLAQVQRNLLLVMHLTQQWRTQDAHPLSVCRLLLVYMRDPEFVVRMTNPLDDPALADAAALAARSILERGWARLEQQMQEHGMSQQREQLPFLQRQQGEPHLPALQRATEDQHRFEALQTGFLNKPGSAAAAESRAAAASSTSSSSSQSTAAAGAGSSSRTAVAAFAASSSSQQASAPGEQEPQGPAGDVQRWEKLRSSLAHFISLLREAQHSGEVDPNLAGLGQALGAKSVGQLGLLLKVGMATTHAHVGGPWELLWEVLANFMAEFGWENEQAVLQLASNVAQLVVCLGDQASARECQQDILTHALVVAQMRQQGKLPKVTRLAPAVRAAADASSSGSSCAPVLRLKGGGPGSSAASSEAGDCPSDPPDGEQCSPGFGAAASASAQEPQHSSPTAVTAATASASSSSSQASSSSSGLPQPTALPSSILQAFESFLGIWRRLLAGKVDTSRLQQMGIACPAVEAATQQAMRDFSPAAVPAHFNSMPAPAAMQWVLLLMRAPYSQEGVEAGSRLQEQLPATGLPLLSKGDAAGDEDELDCRCSAAFTVLLTQDERAWATAAWPNSGAWTAAKQLLLEAVEAAFQLVKRTSEALPLRLISSRGFIKGIVCGALWEVHAALEGGSEGTWQLGQDLAGLKGMVERATQLVRVQLEGLGPQEVKHYNWQDLNDPMLQNGISGLDLDNWRRRFFNCVGAVRRLVLADTCLARAGRRLQRFAKILLKFQKLLPAAEADPYLAGLCRHTLAPHCATLWQHMHEVQSSHRLLRSSLEEAIAAPFWGVLQHGFNLHLKLDTRKRGAQARGRSLPSELLLWMDMHDEVLCRVLADMVHHLQQASAQMPLLLSDWEPQQESLLQQFMWEELLSLFSSMQPPIAGLWFLLNIIRTEGSVASQASGDFVASNSSTRPTTAAAGAGNSSNGRSASRTLSPTVYDSATDPAVLLSAHAAVQIAMQSASIARKAKADRSSIRTALAAFGGCPDPGGEEQEQWDSLCQQEQQTAQLLSSCRVKQRALQQALRRDMQEPSASLTWRGDCRRSLSAMPPPLDYSSSSASSCSSSSSDDDSDTESLESRRLRLRRPGPRQDSSSRTQQQQQGRSIWRQLRAALGYRWGSSRPWHVQRMRTLVARQQQLNQVSRLQDGATAALARLQDVQKEMPGGVSAQGSSLKGLCQEAGPESSRDACDALVRAAAAALASRGADGGSSRPAALSSLAEGAAATLLLQLRQGAWSFQPVDMQHSGEGDNWKASVAFVTAHRVHGALSSPLQQLKLHADAVIRTEQGLQYLSAVDGGLFKELLPPLAAARQRGLVEGGCGLLLPQTSTRQLLWEVLTWFKGSASPWYEAAAAAYQREQLQAASAAALDSPDSSKAAVPECTSTALWSTLTRSLASDLLLVPPSIRDLVGNGWAAGAGRLGAGGDANAICSSSNAAGVAARMLVVQYARAARKQYVQGYQPLQLLGQLLNLQLMAEGGDMLTELQADSAQRVLQALAAYTATATSGMIPVLAAAAAACELAGKPASNGAAQHSSSSGDSRGGGGDGSSGCSSSCSTTEHMGPHMPSLFHLATQVGVFAGPVESTLPWLQLLARYHALLANIEQQHAHSGFNKQQQRQPWKAERTAVFEGSMPEFRVLAMSKALQSFGAPLPTVSAQLQQVAGKFYAACASPPVLAQQSGTPVGPALVGQQGGLQQVPGAGLAAAAAAAAATQTLQRQAVKCAPQQLCMQDAEVWAQCLHAERLMQLQPADWQHYLQHLYISIQGAAGKTPFGSSTSEQDGQQAQSSQQLPQQLRVVADLACDWCCQPVTQPSGSADGLLSGAEGGAASAVWGCRCCGAAQYCSQQCADAAKKVHNANCWRLQGLATDGLCWKKSAYQRLDGSRSLWDLSCVEQ